MSFLEPLTVALKENDISASEKILHALNHYLELLQAWNKVFNLTTITRPRDMVYLHIIDSLIVSPFLEGKNALDVGSGAGLPGIPLAILDPSRAWVLIDKNNKKTRFMTQAVAELKLQNVRVIHARTEDFHPSECFDTILSRAFSTIATFVSCTDHLICPGGTFVAMKGKYPQTELENLPAEIEIKYIQPLNLKGMVVERHIVALKRK